MTSQFKVIAVSENSNSFGLREFVAVNKAGLSYKALSPNDFRLVKIDQILDIPTNENLHLYDFGRLFECPRYIGLVSGDELDKIWPAWSGNEQKQTSIGALAPLGMAPGGGGIINHNGIPLPCEV